MPKTRLRRLVVSGSVLAVALGATTTAPIATAAATSASAVRTSTAAPAPAARAKAALTVSPAEPMAHELTTISGRLTPRASRPVVLQVRKGSRWATLAKGRTNRKGIAHLRARFTRTSTVRLKAPKHRAGHRKLKKTITRTLRVGIVGQSISTTVPTTLTVGVPGTFTATTSPERVGRTMVLEGRTGSGWSRIGTTRSGRSGKVSFRVTRPSAETLVTRVRALAFAGAPVTTSRTSTTTVTAARAPRVSTFTPTSGSTAGDSLVEVAGVDLDTVDRVEFGDIAGTIESEDPTSLTVRTPAHSAGAVEVHFFAGETAVPSDAPAFTFEVPQPGVTAVSPESGSTVGGDTVTLTGHALQDIDAVTFGGVPGVVVSADATTVVVTTPAHLSGVAPIRVSAAGSTVGSESADFTFVAPSRPVAAYEPAATTVTLAPSEVTSIDRLPSGTTEVTLKTADDRFAVGGHLFLSPGHPDEPTGLALRVTALRSTDEGATVVRGQDAPLDEVFSSHGFQQSSVLNSPERSGTTSEARSSQRAASKATAPSATGTSATTGLIDVNRSYLDCRRVVKHDNNTETLEPMPDDEANVQVKFTIDDLQLDVADFDREGQPYYRATVTGKPRLQIVASASSTAKCEFLPQITDKLKLKIPVGSLELEVTPDVSVSFSVEGKVVLEKRYAFEVGLEKAGDGAVRYLHEMTSTPTTISGSVGVGIDIRVGADISLMYLGRVGLSATIGPKATLSYEYDAADLNHCITLALGLEVEISARLDLFFFDWKQPLWTWSPDLVKDVTCTHEPQSPEIPVLSPDLGSPGDEVYTALPQTGGDSPFEPGTFGSQGDSYVLLKNLTLTAGNRYRFVAPLIVPAGVTLTIEHGVHIKVGHCYWTVYLPAGPCLSVAGGAAYLKGTAQDQIIVTRLSDDSVDGNTDGMDPSQNPSGAAPFVVSGGVVTVDGTRFQQSTGLRMSGGGLTVRGSQFTAGGSLAVEGGDGGSLNVSDSAFDGQGVSVTGNTGVTVRDSSFDNVPLSVRNSGGQIVSGNSFRKGSVTIGSPSAQVTGNTFTTDQTATADVITTPDSAAADISDNVRRVSGQVGSSKPVVSVTAGSLSASRVWAAQATYAVTPGVTVPAGLTLRLPAGSVVKCHDEWTPWGTTSCLQVQGSLEASGSADAPVVLTATNDAAAGVDTTMTGTNASAGNDWSMVTGDQTTIELDHTEIRRVRQSIVMGRSTSLRLDHVDAQLAASSALDGLFQISGAATVASSRFTAGDGFVVDALRLSQPAADATADPPSITGSTFVNAQIWNYHPSAVITGNNFRQSAAAADIVASPDGAAAMLAGNTSTRATGKPAVRVLVGAVSGTRTWSAPTTYLLDGNLSVPVDTSLSLDPGVVVKFRYCGNGYSTNPSCLVVSGSFHARGSAGSKVTLTSLNDDTVGGANALPTGTNSGYGDTFNAPQIDSGADVVLDNTEVRYLDTRLDLPSGSHVAITDSTILFNGSGYPAAILSSGDLTVSGSTFDYPSGQQSGSESAIFDLASGTADLHDNEFRSATVRVENPGARVSGNVFKRTRTEFTTSPDGAAADLTDNAVPDGQPLGVAVTSGSTSGTRVWGTPATYLIGGSVTVPAGSELEITAGSTVKFQYCGNGYSTNPPCLTVAGSFRTEGTEAAPVTLTSLNDDTVGGQTSLPAGSSYGNGDTFNAPAIAGSGEIALKHTDVRHMDSRLDVPSDGRLTLDHTTVRITSYQVPAAINSGGHLTVKDATFTTDAGDTARSGALPALSLVGGDPTLQGSRFLNTFLTSSMELTTAGNRFNPFGQAVTTSGSGVIHAQDNWWGQATGPITSGPEAQVTGSVEFDPWCADETCAE